MRHALAAVLGLVALVGCAAEPNTPSVTAPPGPSTTFATIDDLLERVGERYRAGDRAEAAELAATAYLDNYEHLEDEVDAADHELNETLERLLGTELRARIRARARPSEIDALLRRASTLLARAKRAVLRAG